MSTTAWTAATNPSPNAPSARGKKSHPVRRSAPERFPSGGPASILRRNMSVAPQPLLPAVAWFDVADPASSALDELARRFGYHPLQIEDCRHRQQRAKVEEHERYLFMVLKLIHPNHDLRFEDVDVFV